MVNKLKLYWKTGMGLFSGPEILSNFLEIGSRRDYTNGESKTELGKLKPDRVTGRALDKILSLKTRNSERRRNSGGMEGRRFTEACLSSWASPALTAAVALPHDTAGR